MSLAVGADNLGAKDFSILHLIHLKIFRMAKMLEHLAVFISYRDSHFPASFRLPHFLFPAALPADASAILRIAKLIFAAGNLKLSAKRQTLRQFEPCAAVDRLDRCPRNAHLRRALLLRHPFQIDQADRFKLIHRHNDRFPDFLIQRPKPQTERPGADPPSFTWSWHLARLFSLGIV